MSEKPVQGGPMQQHTAVQGVTPVSQPQGPAAVLQAQYHAARRGLTQCVPCLLPDPWCRPQKNPSTGAIEVASTVFRIKSIQTETGEQDSEGYVIPKRHCCALCLSQAVPSHRPCAHPWGPLLPLLQVTCASSPPPPATPSATSPWTLRDAWCASGTTPSSPSGDATCASEGCSVAKAVKSASGRPCN